MRYSAWALIADPDNPQLKRIHDEGLSAEWYDAEPRPVRWTDDYGNLMQALY